jgi:hypothetical protein
MWANCDPCVAQEVADALKRENIKSVNYRYRERTRFKKCDLSGADLGVTPAEVLELIECLDYQSCEHPDYQRGMLMVIKVAAQRAVVAVRG